MAVNTILLDFSVEISITIVFRPVLVMRGHVCGRKTCDAGSRSKVYTTLDTLYP